MSSAQQQTRSAYSVTKQLRRALLRAAGRWQRGGYDVRIVYVDGIPKYKQIRFATPAEAARVSTNLRAFAGSPHVPAWREHEADWVRVDFVTGPTCQPVTDTMLSRLADCLGAFGQRAPRSIDLLSSRFWQVHLARLDYLQQTHVIDARLRQRLTARSQDLAPATLTIGYDYTDPIPSNLVQRDDDSRAICAIDVKNLRADQPLGLGIAKMGERWLTPARRPLFFQHLRKLGLETVVENFEFLTMLERVQRAARKTAADARMARLLTKTRGRRRALSRLVE